MPVRFSYSYSGFTWLIIGLFALILAVTTFLRVYSIIGHNFPLTYDQGRDLMEIRSLALGRPALVGPTTSINGAFLGPFWYYFNLLPFWLGAGDPQAILLWQIVWYQLTGLLMFLYFFARQKMFALTVAGLYLLMPLGFVVNHYFWNAHAMVMVTSWYLLIMFWARQKNTASAWLAAGLITGLALQIEAAWAVLFLPVSLWWILRSRPKLFWPWAMGVAVTLIPQLLYELRHQFAITQTLVQQFTGQAQILGERLALAQRLANRRTVALNLLKQLLSVPSQWSLGLASICGIGLFLPAMKPQRQLADAVKLSFDLILAATLFYLVFPQPLKQWYLSGLSLPLIYLLAVGLVNLADYLARSRAWLRLMPAGLLLLFLSNAIPAQLSYAQQSRGYHLQDPRYLPNQMQVVDWIYQQANGSGFAVYSYLPEIYDYSYQHVFWWYGRKKYHQSPVQISYGPHVPAYIKNQSRVWPHSRPPNRDELIFLIIEPEENFPDRQKQWLEQFQNLCLLQSHTFDWGTTVQIKTDCTT